MYKLKVIDNSSEVAAPLNNPYSKSIIYLKYVSNSLFCCFVNVRAKKAISHEMRGVWKIKIR